MTQQPPNHPTRKPVMMVYDAMLDCSDRGGIVLDAFAGSGTTLIAAEKAGRIARLIELDEAYCDLIILRFEQMTGKKAIHQQSGDDFQTIKTKRNNPITEGELS